MYGTNRWVDFPGAYHWEIYFFINHSIYNETKLLKITKLFGSWFVNTMVTLKKLKGQRTNEIKVSAVKPWITEFKNLSKTFSGFFDLRPMSHAN